MKLLCPKCHQETDWGDNIIFKENNNPNNLTIGDMILVEEAWEDENGYYHDESAFIKNIAEDGELTLDFRASQEVKEFLSGCSGYYAKDFKKEI